MPGILSVSSYNFQKVLDLLAQLSFLAMGYSSPNPPVACVITDLVGNILSTGFTQKTGKNHAEREAYHKFSNKNIPHILFVTLEPCSHFGKTPPCLDLLLEHKPIALVYGMRDTNPIVQKRDSLQECRLAGIQVYHNIEVEKIAKHFLSGFFSRIQRNRPVVWVKSAISIGGYFAQKDKSRFLLSDNESNNLTQYLRAKLDAVLVGPGTVYHDEPKLNLRGVKTLKSAHKKSTTQDKFFEYLFKCSKISEICEFHYENLVDYQPLRVFVLNSDKFPSEKFIKRQETINHFNHSKKSLFFILEDDTNIYTKKELSILHNLSNTTPEFVSKKEFYPIIIRHLSDLGVNTLLVEGGNFMYSIFSMDLQNQDSIVLINTQTKLEDGIKPNLDVQKLELTFLGIASKDTWKIYKKVV